VPCRSAWSEANGTKGAWSEANEVVGSGACSRPRALRPACALRSAESAARRALRPLAVTLKGAGARARARMPVPRGAGASDFSQAVHLLKSAAEHDVGRGETEPSYADKRESTAAMAQSMQYFESALDGARASRPRPRTRYPRRSARRHAYGGGFGTQTRTLARRRGKSWKPARRASAADSQQPRTRRAAPFWPTWRARERSHFRPLQRRYARRRPRKR
jgi:hypothetical protein